MAKEGSRKKERPRSTFPTRGPLAKPIRVSPIWSIRRDCEPAEVTARSLRYAARAQINDKMILLAEHFGIPDGPERWYRLAQELALALCPGFRIVTRETRGAPSQWSWEANIDLLRQVKALKREGNSESEAVRQIVECQSINLPDGRTFTEEAVRSQLRRLKKLDRGALLGLLGPSDET